MGSAWQREGVSRREMGEGPFGDSDASVEACRDRDLSEWGGMGLLEAKLLVVWAFTLVVGHERGAFCLQAVRRTANGQVKAI